MGVGGVKCTSLTPTATRAGSTAALPISPCFRTATSTLAPPTNASSAFHTAGPVCLERLRLPRRVVDRRRRKLWPDLARLPRCGLPTSGENGLQHVDPGVSAVAWVSARVPCFGFGSTRACSPRTATHTLAVSVE